MPDLGWDFYTTRMEIIDEIIKNNLRFVLLELSTSVTVYADITDQTESWNTRLS